jgi:hypothetical protein
MLFLTSNSSYSYHKSFTDSFSLHSYQIPEKKQIGTSDESCESGNTYMSDLKKLGKILTQWRNGELPKKKSASYDYLSVKWNHRDALFIQFIENQWPLHVSSITCSSSGGVTQTAFGKLRAYNASWLWHGCSVTTTVPQPADIIRTQYTKCRLCSASWGWARNVRNM